MYRFVYASVSMALDSVTAVCDTAMNFTTAVLSSEAFYITFGIFGFCWALRG